MKEKLICPGCMHPLETDGSFRYDDVCGPRWSMKHICVNDDCKLSRKAFWNDFGEYFSGDMAFNDFEKIYGHDKYAAFNSFSKKSEIEIYKKGLTKKKYLSPILTLGWLKPYIEYKYIGDEMGNILKKKYSLKFLKRNENNEFTIHYTSTISSILFTLRYFRREIKYFKKNPSRYAVNEIFNHTKLPSWDNRLYKKIILKFNLFYYKKTIKKAYYYQVFYDYLNKIKYETIDKDIFQRLKSICPKELDLLSELLKDHKNEKFIKNLIRKEKLKKLI